MKKLLKLAGVLLAFAIAFTGCSSDDEDSGNSTSGESNVSPSQGESGSTKYIINENDTSKGFVSTNGTIKDYGTGYAGYDGKVIDSLGSEGYVVYSITSASTQDVQMLLHYGFWGTKTELRGAYIIVNGSQDEEIIYCNWTSKNGKNDNIATYNADGTAATYHSIWEDSNAITVSLDAGENQIRVIPVPKGTSMPDAKYPSSVTISDISSTSDYLKSGGNLPNIDYLQITGTGIGAGSNSLAFYSVKTSGDMGSITVEPEQTYYKKGSSVKLTPKANDGYKFNSYSGRSNGGTLIGSASSDYTLTIDDDYTIEAHFVPESYTAPTASDGYMGYATVTSDKADAYTISGGAGGQTIEIAALADLTTYAEKLSSDTPYIVKFTNETRITTSDNVSTIMSIGSNKTVYGAVTGAGLKNIEMRVSGENVIIRNLVLGEVIAYDTYKGTGNDALSLNGARHVWVDHCELRSNTTPKDNTTGTTITNSSDSDFAKDFYDGLLDLKNGATWITISNCYFHDHYKAVLCASGDDGPDSNTEGYSDTDMRVTFYKNYFYNINARMPLFRYGTGHILNNYFDAGTFSGQASCINCRANSKLYIEGNSFNKMKSSDYTIGFYYADSSKKYGNISGSWNAVSNNTCNGTGGSSSVSAPAYSYTAPTSCVSSAPSTSTDVGAILTLSY
ncbi:MAG: polysaccharide lyase family 1 protein [Treponema sp.]|nr:polysaccharide lyase family 1 protein [Treponema sp.]